MPKYKFKAKLDKQKLIQTNKKECRQSGRVSAALKDESSRLNKNGSESGADGISGLGQLIQTANIHQPVQTFNFPSLSSYPRKY